MKKLITAVGLSAVLLLAGCEEATEAEGNELYLETVQEYETDYGYGDVVRDPDTGCMYFESGGPLTPYYDSDGQIAGCGDVQQ